MTIDEAIETSEYIEKAETIMWSPKHYAALRLVIEAAKRLKELRIDNPETVWQLLPGETKD